jgi:parallel beta helix pectate lyase-like protein
MRHLVSFCLSVLLGLTLARPAAAAHRCGDDVDGHAAACGCGDLLVSSRTLGPADGVTRERCAGDGLIVAAPGPVTLAFGGRTIRGDGQGNGILVLSGSLALTGPGTVGGFATGLVASGGTRLRSAIGMRFTHNRLDGVSVSGDGFTIEGSLAEANGRDGFALRGREYALDGNRATSNGRYGFDLAGSGAHVGAGVGNEADGNGMDGFVVNGMMLEIVGVTAARNGGDGFYASVMHALVRSIRADGNHGDGIRIAGMSVAIAGNTATGNRGVGIWVSAMGVDDQGGNRGSDNAGLTGHTDVRSVMFERAPALAQCRIGMAGTCR